MIYLFCFITKTTIPNVESKFLFHETIHLFRLYSLNCFQKLRFKKFRRWKNVELYEKKNIEKPDIFPPKYVPFPGKAAQVTEAEILFAFNCYTLHKKPSSADSANIFTSYLAITKYPKGESFAKTKKKN